MISVVVPTLDEGARIAAALAALAEVPGLDEILVVDGGSTDDTVPRARAAGARVLASARGRAAQQNAGAAAARGDVLVFLHADTRLPRDATAHITRALADPGVVAGAFRTWTVHDGPGPAPWFAPLLHLADLRSRLGRPPYGDQALFVRRAAFVAAGGFPAQPLLEDLELSRRLARLGRVRIVPARVAVSGRRFVAHPFLMTALVNVYPALYAAGVSPATLARWYRHVR